MSQQPAEFIGRKAVEGATHFTLSISLPDGARTLLDRWPVEPGEIGVRDLIDRVEERAERHAQLGPTVGVFVCEAIQEVVLETGRSRFESLGCEMFRVAANTPGARIAASEPANEVGLLAQLMRHNESTQAMFGRAMNAIAEQATERLNQARRYDAEGLEARLKLLEVAENVISQRADRERADREADARTALKREGFEKLLTAGQTVANTLIMQKGGQAGEDMAAAMGAMRVFEQLSLDQLKGILQLLAPEQQAVVMQFVSAMAKKRAAKEEGANGTHH